MEAFEVDKENLYISPIASVIAGDKMEKKLFRLTKKIFKEKGVRRGVKEVCKSIRKGFQGIVILAADVTPVDVISHIPVLCEKNGIPYIFVRSRVELGLASNTKRPTSAVFLVEPSEDNNISTTFAGVKDRLQKILA